MGRPSARRRKQRRRQRLRPRRPRKPRREKKPRRPGQRPLPRRRQRRSRRRPKQRPRRLRKPRREKKPRRPGQRPPPRRRRRKSRRRPKRRPCGKGENLGEYTARVSSCLSRSGTKPLPAFTDRIPAVIISLACFVASSHWSSCVQLARWNHGTPPKSCRVISVEVDRPSARRRTQRRRQRLRPRKLRKPRREKKPRRPGQRPLPRRRQRKSRRRPKQRPRRPRKPRREKKPRRPGQRPPPRRRRRKSRRRPKRRLCGKGENLGEYIARVSSCLSRSGTKPLPAFTDRIPAVIISLACFVASSHWSSCVQLARWNHGTPPKSCRVISVEVDRPSARRRTQRRRQRLRPRRPRKPRREKKPRRPGQRPLPRRRQRRSRRRPKQRPRRLRKPRREKKPRRPGQRPPPRRRRRKSRRRPKRRPCGKGENLGEYTARVSSCLSRSGTKPLPAFTDRIPAVIISLACFVASSH